MNNQPSKKLENPLLSAAGQSFPYENFTGDNLFMPVTPATPAVLRDDDDPAKSETGAFLIQGQVTASSTTTLLAEEPIEPAAQESKQGYFTSILSSFPNISLSNKNEPVQTASYQQIPNPASCANFQVPPPAGFASGIYGSQHPELVGPQENSGIVQPTAPPLSLPPSGGKASYRLGNQRRLKYAPPPDLTSTPTQPFPVTSEPVFQTQSVAPSSYFIPGSIPGAEPQNPQSTSLQSFFRSSPIPTPASQPPPHSFSAPRLIPGRIPEPATPQNTPATSDFPQFSAFPQANFPRQSTSVFPTSIEETSSGTGNFKPISAEKLEERLENLIAERSEDFSSVKNVPELEEIDLNEAEKIVEPSTSSVGSFFQDSPISQDSGLSFPGFSQTQQVYQVPAQLAPSVVGGNDFFSGFSEIQTDGIAFGQVPEPSGSATLSPTHMSVNTLSSRSPSDTVPPSLQNLAAIGEKRMHYRPVYQHWFYRKEIETKSLWLPFSMHDSLKLEEVHNSNDICPETKVATDGGRYDVDILRRQRSPVYWNGVPNDVRRCSWFYKGPSDSRYVPYEEHVALRLEEEYKQACSTNKWNRRLELSNGEYIIFHSANLQVHHLQPSTPEMVSSWSANPGSEDTASLQGAAGRPRDVKRGVDEFHIDDGEPEKIDHLLFLVHGIGSVCDLKFRSVEEVVDEFRSISLQLVQSHYRTAHEQGIVNRIEVLPVSWHASLHSEDTGIDKKLKAITLDSIPKLRHFTNDTLLDILFYTSPIYCQTIMQTVGKEMNRLHALFNERNPEFQGGIYLGGHSLGSLIMFDLLCHQHPPTENLDDQQEDGKENEENVSDSLGPMKKIPATTSKRKLSRKVSYVIGTAGTGQPFITYPQLNFHPRSFFALGSPIGMFVTVRGIDNLGENFVLPTCPSFFNIFHPFDPVAYRVESLINQDAKNYRPMLIPHHKGRKRMHLELKETMARVGADLKQRLLDSVRSTWNSVYQLAMFHKSDNQTLEQEIDKVVEEQMSTQPNQSNSEQEGDDGGADFKVGMLNGGRRIDYVLQEAPFEYINEYIFALSSHVCYWESEDTMLLILKEIYSSMGIQTDAQLPQQSLSIERSSTPIFSNPSTSTASSALDSPVVGMDPTAPMSGKITGPPPISGFTRKIQPKLA